MATVTKIWTFTSDAEGLVDEALTNKIAFAHDAGEASVKFTSASKGQDTIEGALNGSTGETWEDWGVPAGMAVSDIQVTGWLERTADNTKLTSHDITATIINSAAAAVSATPIIDAFSLSTTIQGSFTSQGPETQQAVTGGNQASTTDVRLRLAYHMITTGGGGNAAIDWRMDTIELEITYAEAVARRIFLIT